MLYTEGNLRAEDRALRHIARSQVRVALHSFESKTNLLVDSVIAQLDAGVDRHLTPDQLLDHVQRHPRLQADSAIIERYTNAFPELEEVALTTRERIATSARRRLEGALAPFEFQRRFRFTRGLSH